MLELTILMVESDAIEAKDIKLSIESLGYKISNSVSNGEDVIRAINKTNPDIIFVDATMNNQLDGFKIAKTIDNNFNIPTIYLTDDIEQIKAEMDDLNGSLTYLLKPFTTSELQTSMEYVVFSYIRNTGLLNDLTHFKNIFDKAPIGIFHSTVEGKLLRINSAYARIYGYDSTEELINVVNKSTIQDIIYVDPDIRKILVDEVVKDEEWHTFKNQYYHKDGNIIDAELSFRAVKNHNKKVLYLEGFVNDISEKKKTEDVLKETESLYNIISENTGDVIWIMDLKTQKFTYVSPSVYDLRGYTPEEVLNQKIDEVMTPDAYKYIKENLPKRIKLFLAGNQEWKVTQSEVDQYRKDGSIVPTEVVTTLLLDPQGEVNEILGVSRDITERKKIERNLRESEEKNRLLIESAGIGIGYYDTAGTILMMNKIGASQLNGKPEDFIGRSIKDVTSKEFAESLLERIKIAAESKDSQIYEDHLRGPDYEKWFIFTYTRIENSDGDIIGIQIVSNDITAVKKTQRERDRFFNLSSNLLCITDFDGYFKQLNPAWEVLLGWSENELLSRPIHEFIHPKDRSKTPIFNEFVGGDDANLKFENRFKTKDESYKWLSWSVNILQSEGIVFADVRDVTKQKLSEEALMESEKKYRTLFEYDPDYTLLFNKDGIIVDANNAITMVTGLPKNRLIGNSLYDTRLYFREDIANLQERFSQIIENKENQIFETEMIDKHGNTRCVHVNITVIEMENDILYVLVIASDITEIKQFETELKGSIREKEVLLKEIHHRVKNNMQIISSLMNIQTRYLDDKESINVLKESQNRVKSMSMIHEKLYRSKKFDKVYFAEYIENLVWDLFYSYSIEKGKIEPILEIEDVKLNIETSVPLGLILTELVSNCLKYAFPDSMTGTLYVSLKKSGENYELIIKDDGIGFPETIDFKNTDSLGLQLVNSLTDQIDGEIELNNSNGTEFRIQFKELIYKERI
ncbi:MAG: PAS domain S-box protein [Methanobacterium sp.]|nr:PAS domain S-box protein [Methanobacterium sp.]